MTLQAQFDIITESLDYDVLKSRAQFNKACSIYALEAKAAEETSQEAQETNKKKASAFRQFIERIWNAIKRALSNFANAIKSLFGKSDNLTPEEYFEDPNVQIQFEEDAKKIADNIEKKAGFGKKLIAMISRGTGVSEKEIQAYCDEGAEYAKGHFGKIAGVVISGAAALATGKILQKKVSDIGVTAAECKKMCDQIDANDPDKREKIAKVYEGLAWYEKAIIKVTGGHFAKMKQYRKEAHAAELDDIARAAKQAHDDKIEAERQKQKEREAAMKKRQKEQAKKQKEREAYNAMTPEERKAFKDKERQKKAKQKEKERAERAAEKEARKSADRRRKENLKSSRRNADSLIADIYKNG